MVEPKSATNNCTRVLFLKSQTIVKLPTILSHNNLEITIMIESYENNNNVIERDSNFMV